MRQILQEPVQKYKVYFNGRELGDVSKTLEYYGVVENSTICIDETK